MQWTIDPTRRKGGCKTVKLTGRDRVKLALPFFISVLNQTEDIFLVLIKSRIHVAISDSKE
jgi:hypothetical protein